MSLPSTDQNCVIFEPFQPSEAEAHRRRSCSVEFRKEGKRAAARRAEELSPHCGMRLVSCPALVIRLLPRGRNVQPTPW
jgi:hypothetical protein